MIIKRVIILCLVLLAMATSYYFLVSNKAVTYEKGFLNSEQKLIKSLSIFKNEKQYCFVQENNIWYLTKPKKVYTDNAFFIRFVDELTQLPVTQIIVGRSENLETFGLDHPEIQIRITYNNDKNDDWLLLGNNNEASTSTYARLKGNEQVVLLGIILKQDVEHIIEDLSRDLMHQS
jgi:hypothetical protein